VDAIKFTVDVAAVKKANDEKSNTPSVLDTPEKTANRRSSAPNLGGYSSEQAFIEASKREAAKPSNFQCVGCSS